MTEIEVISDELNSLQPETLKAVLARVPQGRGEQELTADSYQEQAMKTALPAVRNLSYMLLGLCNEAGEVAGKYKKVLRGDVRLNEVVDDITKELGDAAWYLAGAAEMCGASLGDVMQGNLDKLNDRRARGVIKGNGDNR